MPAIIIMPHELIPEGQTYHPLSPSLRSGLMAISVLALISFIVSATLFFYLTYKLVAWHFFVRRRCKTLKREQQQRKQLHEEEEERQRQMKDRDAEMQEHHKRDSAQEAMDFTLGIDGIFTKGQTLPPKPQTPDKPVSQQHVPEKCHQIKPYSSPPNQFLLLIYNLLLADLHQGMAFALNASWLRRDGIMVGTPTCWTQGFFVSTGDLGSSMFITLIAIHTYMSVVLGYRPSQKTVYNAIISVWIFVYVISLIPIGTTRNGAAVGGFFVRAGSWCWINKEYENIRLLTHYLWIFLALATTSGLYIAIFFSLRRQGCGKGLNGDPQAPRAMGHNPAFLIYPIIYVTCTLPLATGRVATMAGGQVPLGYFCFAGALISFNGFFDCLLFGTTRQAIIFASKYDVDAEDTGVDTIAFLKTPTTRRYGNMIWIQGGGARRQPDGKSAGGWWSWQRLAGQPDSRSVRERNRGASQESLRGPGIQMDMVTSVVVEVDEDKETDLRYPEPAASASSSVNSTEREFSRTI